MIILVYSSHRMLFCYEYAQTEATSPVSLSWFSLIIPPGILTGCEFSGNGGKCGSIDMET